MTLKIFHYDEGTPDELNLAEIIKYIGQKLRKVEIEAKGNPFINLARNIISE